MYQTFSTICGIRFKLHNPNYIEEITVKVDKGDEGICEQCRNCIHAVYEAIIDETSQDDAKLTLDKICIAKNIKGGK